jgi:SAM-dependent methyltransferase
MTSHLDLMPPSAWVQRWLPMLKQRGSVLDVACGAGRHVQLLSAAGFCVTAIDASSEALQIVSAHSPTARTVQADIEQGTWPLMHRNQPQQFDAIIVTNYLHRPLLPILLASLTDGGVLIYETFAAGQESVGKPSRPEFLLNRGELLSLCHGLIITAYEDVFLHSPDRFVQRIVAVKPLHF